MNVLIKMLLLGATISGLIYFALEVELETKPVSKVEDMFRCRVLTRKGHYDGYCKKADDGGHYVAPCNSSVFCKTNVKPSLERPGLCRKPSEPELTNEEC